MDLIGRLIGGFILGLVVVFFVSIVINSFCKKNNYNIITTIEPDKRWSYLALIIAFSNLLLFYYGNFYAIIGVFIGFMGLIFMSMVYFMLYREWEDLVEATDKQDVERRRELSTFRDDVSDTI